MAEKKGNGHLHMTIEDIDWVGLYSLSIKHRNSKEDILDELELRLDAALSADDTAKSAMIARTIIFYREKCELAIAEAERKYVADRCSDEFPGRLM